MADEITNAEFLNAIFGAHLDSERDPRLYAWVCRHSDDWTDPKRSKGFWTGSAWDEKDFIGGANTYFSIALLKRVAEKGAVMTKLARRQANFAMLPCVFLDDVGTKVPLELPVKPSWLIETSPGNHQAGYIFAAPIENASDAKAFIKALAGPEEAITDKGGLNAVRYARLPVGTNLKHVYRDASGMPPEHRLVEWNPDVRYEWKTLADQWGLDLEVHTPVRNRKSRGSLGGSNFSNDEGDEVFTGKAEENPVITRIKSRGLYKTPLGSGMHSITCPWVSEHTDQIDDGAKYWEPDGTYLRGGFKCHHGHCEGRKIGTLLEFLAVNNVEAKNRPQIRIIGGALHTIVAHAERLMAETGYYFQQGGLLVQIVTDPRGETRVIPLTKPSVQMALTRLGSWQRFDKRSDDWFEVDAPTNHSTVLWDASEYRHLPVLLTLVRQPFMRPNGTIATQAGYDSETGIYGVFDPRDFPIIESPTRSDAANAMKKLAELLSGFEFKTASDKAAALSAILTAAVRASLPNAPGFLATAHSYGSGKSYLLDLIAAFATPDEAAATTFVTDDDEMRKQLVATLMESPPVIKFDEMKGDLTPVKCLLSALTSERIEGRILGVSKMARPSTRTLMLFAGNNVTAIQDMTRRIVTITLDPMCETPATRAFANDPLRELVRADRGGYLAAALTVVRAWVLAGSPRTEAKALNGFAQWSDWCRQPLLWLGLPDPCEAMFTQMADDPERETLARLLGTWYSCFGNTPTKVRDLIRRSSEVGDLHDVLNEVAGYRGDIDAHRLGKWLKASAGKIVDGKRLSRDTTFKTNSVHWRVVTIISPDATHRDYRDYRDSSAGQPNRDSRVNRDQSPHAEKMSSGVEV